MLGNKKLRLALLIALVIELGFLVFPIISTLNISDKGFTAAVLPAVLDQLTNENRQAEKLSALTVNPLLNKVAELKAQDMAEKGYFSHVSPEGKEPWYWFQKVGYQYENAGENLAIDFTESADVTKAWMNSPTHRANIVKGAYTEVGTGIANGSFEGKPTTFVAQVFGRPADAAPDNISRLYASNISKNAKGNKVLGASTDQVASADLKSKESLPIVILIFLGITVFAIVLFKLIIFLNKKFFKAVTGILIFLVIALGVYLINNYIVDKKMSERTSFASFEGEKFNSPQ
ncbi:MAG: CAP domain-containing protein [Candidatus Paceibacterota bacterium]